MSRCALPRLVSVALLLVSVSLLSSSGQAQARSGSVGGHVVDERGTPLARATVLLESVSTGDVVRTTTDADGRYRFDPVPRGVYTVGASTPLHPLRRFGERPGLMAAIELMLGSGDVTGIDIHVATGGVVSGIVRLSTGEPVEAEVAVLPMDRAQPDTVPVTTSADMSGRYRIFGLPTGTYVVAARPKAPMPYDGAGNRVRMVWPGVYGGDDIDSAIQIEIGTGTTIDADVELAIGEAGTIVGQLVGNAPLAAKTYQLRVEPEVRAPSWWIEAWSHAGVNAEGGAFVLPRVAPRAFRVVASRIGSVRLSGDSELLAVGSAAVVAGAETPVALSLGPGFSIAGTHECPSTDLVVRRTRPSLVQVIRAQVGQAGAFRVGDLLPGDYTVGAGVLVSLSSSDVSGLQVPCAQAPATVSGAVVMDGLVVSSPPLVVIAPAVVEGDGPQRVRVIRPDSEGKIDLANVQPGTVHLGAIDAERFLGDPLVAVEAVGSGGAQAVLVSGARHHATVPVIR